MPTGHSRHPLWIWRRLRAMDAREVGRHLARKWHQWQDASGEHHWLAPATLPAIIRRFPTLPEPKDAPQSVLSGLRRTTAGILAGDWPAFGGITWRVDDPPRWHCEHMAGVDLDTRVSAFRLNHRALPGGADIKVIWELSRWQPLVRLAQAARLLGDRAAADRCVAWLVDWWEQNPPYRGWNWTSALEAGMRLVQLTWIDALLRAAGSDAYRQAQLPERLLPPHIAFAWRYRSFGSSANNHLLGELAGLSCALARWPELTAWARPLPEIAAELERAIMAQFAPDGGHREQALQYHLYSWELCWHAGLALECVGCPLSAEVHHRLTRAASFFLQVQVPEEPWDYGDSDSARALPITADERGEAEWCAWLRQADLGSSIRFWIGVPPTPDPATPDIPGWTHFPESGYLVFHDDAWVLRWDLSPLGYLATAAHGHLDALHLSMWHRGRAVLVDPGTGAYTADAALRAQLASWSAHNGPHLAGYDWPHRAGPFLWSGQHQRPRVDSITPGLVAASLDLPVGRMRRSIQRDQNGWRVVDGFEPRGKVHRQELVVRWQFPPGSRLGPLGAKRWTLDRSGLRVELEIDTGWTRVESGEKGPCSPGFREVSFGPFLKLAAPADKACVLTTSFLASLAR